MPTGSPWARLLLGLNVPQSPGLGHNFMSKYPGQEAFWPREEEPHRARGRRQAPSKPWVPGVGTAVEASGPGPRPQCQPCGLLPVSSQHPGPQCVQGSGQLPSGYSLLKEHRVPSPTVGAFEKSKGRGVGGWGGPEPVQKGQQDGGLWSPQIQALPGIGR